MNLSSVHSPVPYHSQYPRTSVTSQAKKSEGKDSPLSFQEILQEKMKSSRNRQASEPKRLSLPRSI